MDENQKDESNNIKAKVVTGIKWLALCKFFGQVLNWGMTLIVIRLVAPSDYGLMAMAMAFVGLVALVNEMGIGASIVQAKTLDKETLPRLFGLALSVNLILFLLSVGFAPFVAAFYGAATLEPLIRLLSLQFLVGAFCVMPKSLLERELNFKKTATVDFFANILSGFLALILAHRGYGVWALAWGGMSLQLFRALFLNIVSPFLHFPQFSTKGLHGFMRFGGFLSGERILWFIYSQADIFILGKLFGADLLGFYSVAKNLSSLPKQKISPLVNQVTMPAFSRIQNDKASVAYNLLKGVRTISFVSFPIFLGLSAVSSPVVEVLLGPEWIQAVPVLTLLCLVMPIGMVDGFVSSVTKGIGRSDVTFINMAIAVTIMPLALFIGSQWGIVGVGYTWLIVSPVIFMISLGRCTPHLGISIKNVFVAISGSALSSFAMFVLVHAISFAVHDYLKPELQLIFLIVSGALSFLVISMLWQKKSSLEIFYIVSGR